MNTGTTAPAPIITVAVVEDDDGIRQSLAAIIKRQADLQCVGAYASAEDALREIPTLRPHVILMDINLPGQSGVECVRALAPRLPETHIVMLTVFDEAHAIFDSLAAGAIGYLLKPAPAPILCKAIREVHAGGAPMSAQIARMVVQAFKKPAAAKGSEHLSHREHQVLELLAKGLASKEIADQLGISYWTVETYVAGIYKKLHVRSRAQAVAKFLGDSPRVRP